ncbi:pyridoxal-phosphate dependent enzyme [Micromonospora sp. WMMD882]|uniref:threonine synthase n=1 Tax=Micromonospora sp. WMMD882 TaxID=3015151 RepID=UPI00248A9F45|nr:pyridoxal-phosphate dependent enzyme [Micromonospora sp. WMMD882]WBB81489.1 pyridoxal-phosphate dependent enzyme [Micromonospora sp. WMMD882]
MTIVQNPRLTGLACLRCDRRYEIADHTTGCPACLAEGAPANLECVYRPDGADRPAGRVEQPYLRPVTLGEGGTPLLTDLAGVVPGIDVALKWEGANPTGSHKDRFSAAVVTRAAHAGYEGVVAASSGNAGVSLAAYCGRAGLRCEVAVTDDTPARVVELMRDLGADVVSFPRSEQRWEHTARYRDSTLMLPVTNFVVPPVGSSPFGIEGYKLVAEEILADRGGSAPEWVVVPASRGDLAWGVHLGFRELLGADAVPRLCLVEPFPRVAAVLAGADQWATFPGDTRVMPSLGGNLLAAQSVEAVRRSRGHAEPVDDESVRAETRRLWRTGFPLEPSSAAGLVAVSRALAAGRINPDADVVVLATAHGLKGM